MSAVRTESPGLVDRDATQGELAELTKGAGAALVVGVFGATGIALLSGFVQHPGEPAMFRILKSAATSVRLPSGVDPVAVSLSLSGIVLTLVLTVSLSYPRQFESIPAAIARSVWLSRLALGLSIGACIGQVWLCAASVATSMGEGPSAWGGVAASALATTVICVLVPLTVTRHDLMLDRENQRWRLQRLTDEVRRDVPTRSLWRAFPWTATSLAAVVLLALRVLVTAVLSSATQQQTVIVVTILGGCTVLWSVSAGAWVQAGDAVQRITLGTRRYRIDKVFSLVIGALVSALFAGAVAIGVAQTDVELLGIFISLIVCDILGFRGIWCWRPMRRRTDDLTQAMAAQAQVRAEQRISALDRRVQALSEREVNAEHLRSGRSRGFSAPRRVGKSRRSR